MHPTFREYSLRFREVHMDTLKDDIRISSEDDSLAHITLGVFKCVYCDRKS